MLYSKVSVSYSNRACCTLRFQLVVVIEHAVLLRFQVVIVIEHAVL